MILLDTSGLLAAIDSSQNHHVQAAAAIRESSPPLLLSPFVLAELDYLLAVRVSTRAQRALLDEVARGAYRLEPFNAQDVASALVVLRSYPGHEIGLADASIVVLAERHGVVDVLTLDQPTRYADLGVNAFGYCPLRNRSSSQQHQETAPPEFPRTDRRLG